MSRPYRKSLLSVLLPRLGRSSRSASAPKETVRSPTASAPLRPFQAVSIQCGGKACDMSRRLKDRRFLARKAPDLPLPGCPMSSQCQCRYLKHADRRVEFRRLTDLGLIAVLFGSEERRASKGRRSTDK